MSKTTEIMTKIKRERLRRGWSQQTLAFHAGIGVADVSRIETGRLRPYPGQTRRLSRVLQMSPGELQDLETIEDHHE